ncbi:class I SAM-dependent RNA methyltransferase [Jatrophihabitans fulvus]
MAERAGGDGPLAGATLELRVGGPAHGGSCVARHPDPDGRVVFVRHALPGERVRALVTADRGGAYCFADAVEVLEAAPGRVAPPCPHAGPGRCGGCDWQHADPALQRELKATVVREQFAKLAGLDVDALGFAGVEELPGGMLGWRTRVQYASRGGTVGLHPHASHAVLPIDRCPLGVPGVDVPPPADTLPADATGVELVAGTGSPADPPDLLPERRQVRRTGREGVAVLAHRPSARQRDRRQRGRRPPDRVEVVAGPATVTYSALGRDFEVASGGFWQVHPAAVDTFAAALLEAAGPQPGERVLDLYAGAGALTAALADAVGEQGAVIGVESSAQAVRDAARNLADLPQAQVRHGRVDAALLTGLEVGPDVVVLDPPRAGAGRDVMTALAALGPRVVGYVACDPAALARDVAVITGLGWELASLRAFDAFPMTHHVECVAALRPPGT